MHTPRRRSRLLPVLALAALVALVAAACGTGGGTPAPTPSPTQGPLDSAEAAARAIGARNPLLAGIPRQDPGMIGNASAWQAELFGGDGADGGWRITFRAGWGDCEAGCIDQHTWTWEATRAGGLTLVAEEGPALPQAVVDELRAAGAGREPVAGIAGMALAGPTCPVVGPEDTDCGDRSVAGAVLVVTDAAGTQVGRVQTDDTGFFRLALGPGTYTVTPQAVDGVLGTAAPVTVTVGDGSETWVLLGYDTGIR